MINIEFFLWLIYVSYLNSTCKEKSSNVIKFVDALKAFKDKLANCAMFGKLDMLLDSKQKKIDIIKTIKLI